MKVFTRSIRMLVIPLVGASIVACAPFFEDGVIWRPTSGIHAVHADLRQSIGYYENAVTAIDGRHYALALEYLQAARAQNPNDVRVLTAFGVVYDKLGRFDLSARYYTQAAAIEPKSTIIAADLAYSRSLQALTGPAPNTQLSAVTPRPAEGIWHRAVGGPETRPQTPAQTLVDLNEVPDLSQPNQDPIKEKPLSKMKVETAKAAKTFFLTGHPLTILDASGRIGTEKSVRFYLLGLGWTVARSEDAKRPVQQKTIIVYENSKVMAAKALARTLSLPMRLTPSNDVQGLQLILGGDISGSNLSAWSPQSEHRVIASATTNSAKRE